METTPDTIIDEVTRVLAEEAHLIGQELQDSLTKPEMDRLSYLSAKLDELDGLLERRRPLRGHGSRNG